MYWRWSTGGGRTSGLARPLGKGQTLSCCHSSKSVLPDFLGVAHGTDSTVPEDVPEDVPEARGDQQIQEMHDERALRNATLGRAGPGRARLVRRPNTADVGRPTGFLHPTEAARDGLLRVGVGHARLLQHLADAGEGGMQAFGAALPFGPQ